MLSNNKENAIFFWLPSLKARKVGKKTTALSGPLNLEASVLKSKIEYFYRLSNTWNFTCSTLIWNWPTELGPACSEWTDIREINQRERRSLVNIPFQILSQERAKSCMPFPELSYICIIRLYLINFFFFIGVDKITCLSITDELYTASLHNWKRSKSTLKPHCYLKLFYLTCNNNKQCLWNDKGDFVPSQFHCTCQFV